MVLYIEKFCEGGVGVDLNWLETVLFGFVSGLAEILPVSARAHSMLMLKVFGAKSQDGLQYLLIHAAVFAALQYTFRGQIIKMTRARALSRIPKKRRKRPLDVKSLMDYRFLRTMAIPVIVAMLFYGFSSKWNISLLVLSILIFANGILLYVPQFFPGSNKDARTLSRLEGIFMGLGSALSILPGFSAVGAAVSIGSICGVERRYALDMAMILNMLVLFGMMVYDVLAVVSGGLSGLSLSLVLHYALSASTAFAGTLFGVRIMRILAGENGHSVFAFYCWGVALFAFILNLMA